MAIATIKDLELSNDGAAYCIITQMILFPVFTIYLTKTMRDYRYLINPSMKTILISSQLLLFIRLVFLIGVMVWYLVVARKNCNFE